MISIPIALFILLVPFTLAGLFVTGLIIFYEIKKKREIKKDLKKGEK